MLAEHSVVCPILIGRAAPLSTVHHTLDRTSEARGSTLLVSGEAGIGKSRLVRAMADEARSRGFVVLEGACFEPDRAHPYAPILDLVRTLADSASPQLAAHYFAPAAAELVAIFPEIAAMFGDAPARQVLDPEADRRRLFHTFAEALSALGRVQPVLVVIEDVHWSDDATLDLLLHVARRLAAQPIALALTFRSDEVGPRLARLLADLDRARCASEVGLRSLTTDEVTSMLAAIFGPEVIFEAAFVRTLHELTEGNPFFVEEVLKGLLDAGDLAHSDSGWRARPLEHVRVPRTATEAVARRLAGLTDAASRVASVAAVAGRRFDFALIQSLTQLDERELLGLIRELVDAQLVVEESADRFAFRHALTREAMRARLLGRERVALHRAIAAAIERDHDGQSHDVDDALAYHTFEAGDWEAARRYALRAAAHASTVGAPREALQQLENALAATHNADVAADAALFTARGRAHETLGAFVQAQEDFAHALDLARAAGDARAAWHALHALGMLWAARDYGRAGDYRHQALDAARALGDQALVARSLNRVGNWFVNREEPQQGLPYHNEALAIMERLGDRRGVAETVDLLAMSHHIAGRHEAAVELFDRAVTLFEALDDKRGLSNALSVIVSCGPTHHASAGPVHTSVHTTDQLTNQRSLRLAGEIGWRAGESFSRWLLADAFAWRGDYERGLRLARESLAIAEELEHLEWQCGALGVLGAIAQDLCAVDESVAQLGAAHELARRLGSMTWIRWTGAPYAISLARASQAARAAMVLDEVDRLAPHSPSADARDAVARTLGTRYLGLARAELAFVRGEYAEVIERAKLLDADRTPRVALLVAQALVALEQWSDAARWLASARSGANAQAARPLLWRIDAAKGAVHRGERRRNEARRSFDAARAAAAELMSAVEDAALIKTFREGIDRLAPAPPEQTIRQATKAAHGGLTRRERDTAALIAQGKSNRAIARALGIGERTVETYVASTLSKLGFDSRAQIAVWAAEHRVATAGTENGANRTRR